jgi:anhydro-N-acetylmuramic acid kinase
MKQSPILIGLMSGTSLDGLDIVATQFTELEEKLSYKIISAATVPYDSTWKDIFSSAHKCSALELAQLNVDFGIYCGKQVKQFIQECNIKPFAIASHGHTIFHQPKDSLTVQIGSGAHIAVESGLPVICDFRTTDVALGGQGAPLVPIGDRLLFSEFDFRVNIGGIANISYTFMNELHAFDICVANMLLNLLAEQAGQPFDTNGEIARRGEVNTNLLNQLNSLDFYQQSPPKSLGKEWFEKNILPVLSTSNLSIRDLLATCTEHVAEQIAAALDGWAGKAIFTGGGSLNAFLIERIRNKTTTEILVPDIETIHFKEALIFALLGYLRLLEENNAIAEVTGAYRDSCGGCIYLP